MRSPLLLASLATALRLVSAQPLPAHAHVKVDDNDNSNSSTPLTSPRDLINNIPVDVPALSDPEPKDESLLDPTNVIDIRVS